MKSQVKSVIALLVLSVSILFAQDAMAETMPAHEGPSQGWHVTYAGFSGDDEVEVGVTLVRDDGTVARSEVYYTIQNGFYTFDNQWMTDGEYTENEWLRYMDIIQEVDEAMDNGDTSAIPANVSGQAGEFIKALAPPVLPINSK
jgi:hypothetical protein